jgi:site-specific DNA-methyltransferase (adenine-specific)
LEKLKIIYKKINDLIPYANNPRNNDIAVEPLKNSIKEFGFKVPIIVDKDGEIVAGHTRLKAAKELELEEVPCVIADDLTPEQVKAFRLADNKVGELAEWDFDLLDLELEELENVNFDMEGFGFEFNLQKEEAGVIEDDFDCELEEETNIKQGDIFQLGRHRLMCGDSTSLEDVQKLAGGVQVDLLVTDPPYNVNYEGATKDKLRIKNDNMKDTQFREFLKDAFYAADSAMKVGASFYIWHADSEGYNFRGACKDIGWSVRQCLIWNKNSLVMGRQDYQWKHEPCLYGWKDGASHLWMNDRKQTTVINMDRPTRNELHPTMKPVALFDYLIKNNTKSGDIVLDIFGGSGTTIMACEQNGRRGFLMELDPKYCDVIIKRWEEFTGEKAVKINE